jgi:hypothetical protein
MKANLAICDLALTLAEAGGPEALVASKGLDDLPAVHDLMAQYKLTPLSAWARQTHTSAPAPSKKECAA